MKTATELPFLLPVQSAKNCSTFPESQPLENVSLNDNDTKIINAFEIVKAVSELEIPHSAIENGSLKKLLDSISNNKNSTSDQLIKIDRLKSEKDKRWAITNFFANCTGIADKDKDIKDAQLGLAESVANLTKDTIDLLLINTSLSKVACTQQKILLEQQVKLEEAADFMKLDNIKIFEKQKQFETVQELSYQSLKEILPSLKKQERYEHMANHLNDVQTINSKKNYTYLQYQIFAVGLVSVVAIVLSFIRL